MDDLTWRPAIELLSELKTRRVSARELLAAHLARYEKVQPALNAVVRTDLERAWADAAQIDDARARGEPLGPLAGLPMTIKDGFDVAGMPAVSGVPALVDRSKDCADADVVATARHAGAVLWGKTNVPLMLGDFQSYNAVFGTTNNPFDVTRTPGGSSGGSASALAAGVTSLEIGSDIGGSLRHPANFCGVHALKPTYGALSLRGQVPPGPGIYVNRDLAVPGPMSRTAADLRLMWDVLRGRPDAAPRPVAGTRVALWLDEPEFVVSDQVRTALLDAAEALRAQGVIVEATAAPVPPAELVDTYLALLFPIIAAGFPDQVFAALSASRTDAEAAVAAGAHRYGPEAFAVYVTASYRDVARVQVVRQRLKDQLTSWFADWDAILSPISPVPAFTHRHEGGLADRVLEVDGRTVPYARMLDWAALATALHTPAVAAPVTQTHEGLPVGAQLIGRWGEEYRLLDLAAALERSTGGFHPPAAIRPTMADDRRG